VTRKISLASASSMSPAAARLGTVGAWRFLLAFGFAGRIWNTLVTLAFSMT
jgi:hypothetical protein